MLSGATAGSSLGPPPLPPPQSGIAPTSRHGGATTPAVRSSASTVSISPSPQIASDGAQSRAIEISRRRSFSVRGGSAGTAMRPAYRQPKNASMKSAADGKISSTGFPVRPCAAISRAIASARR